MIFICLCKWRKKPTKEMIAQSNKLFGKAVKEGFKIVGQYWTLGRYDSVVIMEGKDEKEAMKSAIEWSDIIASETLVAIPRDEAVKLLE